MLCDLDSDWVITSQCRLISSHLRAEKRHGRHTIRVYLQISLFVCRKLYHKPSSSKIVAVGLVVWTRFVFARSWVFALVHEILAAVSVSTSLVRYS